MKFFLLFFLFLPTLLLAQNTLRGSVQDASSGFALSGASIQIKEKNKILFETLSDENGEFMLSEIPDGAYDIFCTLPKSQYNSQKIIQLPLKNNIDKAFIFRLLRGNPAQIDVIMTYASLQAERQRTVTTASMSSTTQGEAPATIYVVTAQDIEQRGYNSLSEVLEDIPEIEIQDRSNYYSYSMYAIRGIQGNKKFIVMLDGVRISSFTGGDLVWDKNISIRHALQVEVLLGPAAALYGSDAVTGVINIITQKPTGTTAAGTVSYGSYHTSENTLAIGLAKGDFSFFANGSAYISQEASLPNFYREDFDWYWNRYQYNGAMHVFGDTSDVIQQPIKKYKTPRHAYWTNAKMCYKNMELGFQRNWQQHSIAIASQSGLSLAWREYAYRTSTTNVYFSHTHQSENNKWSLKTLANWNWYEVSPNSFYADSYNRYTEVYQYAFNHTWQLNEFFSYNFNEKHSLQAGLTGSFTHDLPNGARVLPEKWERGKGSENFAQQYYLGTQTTWQDGRDTQITQNIAYAYQANMGLFAQYQGNIADQLFITLGGRFDYFVLREKRYPILNPRLGLVYKPHSDWTLKGFYGEAFLAPSLELLYSDYTSFEPVIDSMSGLATAYTASYAFIPNANLEPEKLRSGELGLSFAKNNWLAGINGYINALGNVVSILSVVDTSYLGIPVDYAEMNTNGASLLSYGGTAQMGYRLPFGKEKQGKFELSLAYSFSNGFTKDLEGSTALLPYSAMHTVKGSLLFSYKGFSLNFRTIYRSPTYDGGVYDENDEFVYRYNKSFIVFNLYAAYQVLKPENKKSTLSFFVKIRNLSNARYYNASVNYSDTFFASPQDPIRIMGGVSISFAK